MIRILPTALALSLILGCGAGAAQEFKAGPLVISKPWVRATPAGAKVGAGYMRITNTGSEADRLVGGHLAQAGAVEVHEMKVENGVMTMRPLSPGLEVAPGATVTLAPGGYHLMFTNLREPLKQGAPLPGELRFEKAGTVAVEYAVAPVGASGPTEPAAGEHGPQHQHPAPEQHQH